MLLTERDLAMARCQAQTPAPLEEELSIRASGSACGPLDAHPACFMNART
jgi:hypothetical protein